MNNLSLTQQFTLTKFGKDVKELTEEQAKTYLMELLRQVMVKDNLVKELLKERL